MVMVVMVLVMVVMVMVMVVMVMVMVVMVVMVGDSCPLFLLLVCSFSREGALANHLLSSHGGAPGVVFGSGMGAGKRRDGG